MGQKVHPHSFRIGVLHGWKSKWFGRRDYRQLVEADVRLRRYLRKKLRGAGVAKLEVERGASSVTVSIYTAKPGLVIGRGGAQAEDLKKELKDKFLSKNDKLQLNIHEIPNPGLSADVVAEHMALELEKRLPFRRVMKQAIDQVMKAGALGVKVAVSGRLNGAEISRREQLSVGTVPLHTLRADIDYGRTTAQMTYGVLGIKVWINRGEVFAAAAPTPAAPRQRESRTR